MSGWSVDAGVLMAGEKFKNDMREVADLEQRVTSKPCTRCEIDKPLSAFSKGGKWRGTQLYKSVCKECTNVAMRGERSKEGEIARNHFENVTREKCRFGHGVQRIPVKGWGFIGATK